MVSRPFIAAVSAAALLAGTVERVSADAGDAILGLGLGVLGCHVTGACGNAGAQQRSQPTQSTRSYRPRMAVTEEGRQVQTALNYFGYNAGAVDGQIGRGTRAAISRYQSDMGFAPDGDIDPHERDFLLSGYQRAIEGDVAQHHQIALQSGGPRGLLQAFNRDRLGYPPPQGYLAHQPATPPGPTYAAAPNLMPPHAQQAAPGQTMLVAPAIAPPVTATPQAPAAIASTGSLPVFSTAELAPSMAQSCHELGITTTADAQVSAASVTDPDYALSELFCYARSDVMDRGEAQIAAVQGQTEDQIAASCRGMVGVVQAQIAALPQKHAATGMTDAKGFFAGRMQPSQLLTTGQICLSMGYRLDDPDVALASLLMLVAADQPLYGELVGHHLREGFGAGPAPDTARSWYDAALNAAERGAAPAVSPERSGERMAVLRAALGRSGVMAGASPAETDATGGSPLPTFVVVPFD